VTRPPQWPRWSRFPDATLDRILPRKEALRLRRFAAKNSSSPRLVLDFADTLLGGHGVEEVRCETGLLIQFANRGDTYDCTLCWIPARSQWLVSSWGAIVEREDY
jgi:hypothetical protein